MKFQPQETHGDILDEVKATTAGAFLCIESDRGIIRMDGNDARDLLHRLSSARIDDLRAGQLRETLLTNEKGRVIDALLAVQGSDMLRLFTSADADGRVMEWMEKYTIMEDCTYENIGSEWAQFSLYNLPEDGTALFPEIPMPEPGTFTSATLGGIAVELLRHRSVSGEGLRIVCREENAETLWNHLRDERGLPAVGRQAYTLWRVARMLPATGHEIGPLANPLESGAEAAVDFRKGCFIGQEVIARLDSYDKVQRHPRRLLFEAASPDPIAAGAELEHDGTNAGFVTTAVFDPVRGRMVGMGLVRLAYEAPGTALRCSGHAVEVLD